MLKISTYKRKDGRYESRVCLGRKDNGLRKYRSFYGHSSSEASDKALKAFSFTDMECITEITVRELIFEWLSIMSVRIKESTAANYRMKAEKHIIPAFGNTKCSSVSRKEIYGFINCKLSDGLSVRYVSDIIVLMKSVYRYANREYNIKNVIDGISLPRKPKSEITVLSGSEQKRLEVYIRNDQSSTSLGCAIALYTGLRIGELCALKWEDIDIQKRILTVNKTIQRIQCFDGTARTKVIIAPPKSEASIRDIPIPDCLSELLRPRKAKGSCFVMSGTELPLEPRTLQYRFAKLLKNAKLPSVHFHSLRHLFCTNAIGLGFDIKTLSELLGHSSVEVTLNRYAHSSLERKRLCMDLLKWSA